MISYSTNALNNLDWKPDILIRDSNTECEYSEDALDKLISCAKLLTDDLRQITSFIKVNIFLKISLSNVSVFIICYFIQLVHFI